MTSPNAISQRDFLNYLLQQQTTLKIIVDALAQTITGYTKVPVKAAATPFLREEGAQGEIAVAGVIRFESAQFSIELFLGLSKSLFLNLYETMFQAEVDEISAENQDLAAEILNISFGIMDPKFKVLGMNFRSSFPKIYAGAALKKALAKMDTRAITIPFEAQGKPFYIEIYAANSLKENWEYDPKAA